MYAIDKFQAIAGDCGRIRSSVPTSIDNPSPPESSTNMPFEIIPEHLTQPFLFLDYNHQAQSRPWSIPDQTREIFLQLPRDSTGVRVIGVIGGMRKGKSYIMNRLAKRQSGFAVGPSTSSCTHGIWGWFLPREPELGTIDTLLLDTEGMFDPRRQSQTMDQQLFVSALLLSSVLVYNTMTAIDESQINQLACAAGLAQNIFRNEQNSEAMSTMVRRTFPKLLWLVRDFALKLDRLYNKSTDKYLEDKLNTNSTVNDEKEWIENNSRSIIKELFEKIKCCTMVRPAVSALELQEIDKIPFERLPEDFKTDTKRVVNHINKLASPKQITVPTTEFDDTNQNETLSLVNATPTMLLSYASHIIETFNSGSIPELENMWESVSRQACDIAVRKAVDQTEQMINQFEIETPICPPVSEQNIVIRFDDIKKPYPTQEIDSFIESVTKRSIEVFTPLAMGPHFEKAKIELFDILDAKFAQMRSRNNERSKIVCDKIMNQIVEELESRVESNEFNSLDEFLIWKNYADKVFYFHIDGKGPTEYETAVAYANCIRGITDRQVLHFKVINTQKEIQDLETKRVREAKEYANRIAQEQAERERILREKTILVEKSKVLQDQMNKVDQKNNNLQNQLTSVANSLSSIQCQLNNAQAEKKKLEERVKQLTPPPPPPPPPPPRSRKRCIIS